MLSEIFHNQDHIIEQVLQEYQSPFGISLAEQLKSNLQLSAEPDDRIILEMAGEVDELEKLTKTDKKNIKGYVKVQSHFRRLTALKELYELIQKRKDRQGKAGTIAIVANVIRKLRDTLKDLNLNSEQMELIISGLLAKLEETEHKPNNYGY